jgi:hypothetical protein
MKETTIPPRLIQNSRLALLFMIGLTFLNIILFYLRSSISFPYSAFIPYFAVIYGDYLGTMNGSLSYIYIFSIIAILCLAVYIIAWFASRRKYAWFIVVTIVYFIDTLFMGYLLWGTSTINLVIDLALHGFILYSFTRAAIFYLNERKSR